MILTIASSKGGCGKTTLARIILGRLALAGYGVAAVDADFNHSLTDWVRSISRYPIVVEHELCETEVGPLVSRLHEAHDVVVVDTAGAATQATVFAIGAADLVLVPVMTSSADVVEAIKTMNLIRSAGAMMRREVLARVILSGVMPGTNVAAHIEAEIAKAGLPVMRSKLQRLVAFSEMSFTGLVPMSGSAGVQCSNLIDEIEALGVLPENMKRAS